MTRHMAVMFATSTLIAATSATATPSYTVKTVQYPGDTFTQLLGINNASTIAGFHGASVAQGFVLTLPNTFTPQNFPGSATSMTTAINNTGSTAGIYVDTAGTSHGHTYVGGSYMTIDEPGTVFNQALGINDGATTVGYSSATDPTGLTGEVAYKQAAGVFTNLVLPSNVNSQAVGINNAGDIVGFYQPTSTTALGFLDVGGIISTVDPFGSTFAQALGISNKGEIVGSWLDAMGVTNGFVDIGGVITTFDVAGASSTVVNGVNDKGQLVGFYVDANGNTDGFVATLVPEPAVWTLMLTGLGGLGAALRSRRGVLATRA
ncbi:MAG: hypothetical protein JWO83_2514 [Caulobacteraceae bacterium]|nr:hypothetical protein [Caulobacteraceae bacterium]